ncbi:BamA/TamA family outer membrane protein [Aquiflexum lacus]|uniref:BamA/TamA family outer membrane protein n=1 Tax=Aquiflexum lacus TaxID=2483805 RepID=UPI0018955581|nr:BamA/TamA family outer membrane protein [Aquiflexum lacus]
MKYILSALIFLFMIPEIKAQNKSLVRKYLEGFGNNSQNLSRPQFLVYPTIGYSPETNTEFGLSGLYLYYVNQDTSNRLSEITARGFYTLENQYGAFVEHALYSDRDKWFFLGNLRYQSFPLSFFGIGANSTLDDEQIVAANQLLIKERVLRRLKRNFYFGLELELNNTSQVSFSKPENFEGENPIVGMNGFTTFSTGIGFVLDSRHNVLNVRDGYFSELAVLGSFDNLGSDYSFGSVISDTRYFKSIRKNQVLALQLLGQFTWGDVPFNQLPQLGGPNLLRGYYQGRFRDNNLMAAQVEYRFLPFPLKFTERIGGAVFASVGTVYDQPHKVDFGKMKGTAGAGLRYLLFPQKDIYVRLDYAFTREGNAFYIYIGEAF